MLHFLPSSGECCSRSKGHVTGLRDVSVCSVSAVTEKMADRKKKTMFVECFAWQESTKIQAARIATVQISVPGSS